MEKATNKPYLYFSVGYNSNVNKAVELYPIRDEFAKLGVEVKFYTKGDTYTNDLPSNSHAVFGCIARENLTKTRRDTYEVVVGKGVYNEVVKHCGRLGKPLILIVGTGHNRSTNAYMLGEVINERVLDVNDYTNYALLTIDMPNKVHKINAPDLTHDVILNMIIDSELNISKPSIQIEFMSNRAENRSIKENIDYPFEPGKGKSKSGKCPSEALTEYPATPNEVFTREQQEVMHTFMTEGGIVTKQIQGKINNNDEEELLLLK